MSPSLNLIQASATQDLAEYSNILMSTYLEHEISRLSSLRELLKLHDDTVTSIDSLRVKVEKLEATLAPTPKLLDQLSETRRQLEIKKLQLSSLYKGFYFFSLPMNSKLKSQNIRKMVSNYGSTVLVTSHTLVTSSRQLLFELSISPTQAISDTSQILDLLTLKPLDEPPEGLPGPNDGLELSPPWVEALYYSALQSLTAPGFLTSSPLTASTSAVSPSSSPAVMSAVASSESVVPRGGVAKPVPNNPFDNVDAMVSGPSIGAGAETSAAANASATGKSTNPFDEEKSGDGSGSGEVKISPVGGSVRVNQNLLGDLLGGGDGKKGDGGDTIWG
jgi:hypothetical protein